MKPSVDDLPSRPKALEGKKHSKPVKPFMVVSGLVDTLLAKFKGDVADNAILKKGPLCCSLTKKSVKKWRREYYSSPDNVKRSLNNFYSKNVMGKRKYESMRISNSRAIFKGNKVPNEVLYRVLSEAMYEIDNRTLIPFSP